jgi:capsid protein
MKKTIARVFKGELKELSENTMKIAARLQMSNSYGRHGYGTTKHGQKFFRGMSSSGAINTIDHSQSRQNARNALYDAPTAKALEQRFVDTVVDVGLKLKPTPMASMLGIDQDRLEEWAEDVGERFHIWALSKKSDLSETNNFYQNQRLYESFQVRDNDIFVRFHYTRKKDIVNPLQLQFIDPNQIRGIAFTNTYTQFGNDDGIVRDSNGKEKLYKIWYLDSVEKKYKMVDVPAKGAKSGRIFMIHGFNPDYAGQGRGYSRFLHALSDFEKISDLKQSHIIKAIMQSSIFMYTKPSADNPASNVMEGRVATAIDDDYYSTDSAASDAIEDNLDKNAVNWNHIPEATIDDPGSAYVANLMEGEDLAAFPQTAPADNFDAFVDSFTAYLSASLSMPIEVLLMRFNANYSASRGALILFWRVAQIWRNEMAADYLNPVYESWLSEEIAIGRITAPGWSEPVMKQAWLMCEWMGAPMPNIDPFKEARAKKEWVELGAETLDDVAQGHNSSSGKSNRAKNKRQIEELTEVPWTKRKTMGGQT